MTLVLWLLVLSVAINYIDRGLLSVSAPLLTRELSLSPVEMGVLFSAFFWTYSLFHVVAGWLVDRYDVKWVYAGAFLVWSLATGATALVTGLGTLLAARLMLGVGESVAYPACSRIIAQGFPEARRGVANALVDVGSKVGPALSTLAGGLLVDRFGWRALFAGVGLGSLFWLIPWALAAPNWRGAGGGRSAEPAPGFPQLLARCELWGTSLSMFCLGYVWYFLLSWLPSYLVQERGLSMSAMATFGSAPFWVMAGASLLGGWASDRWIRAGATPTRVRKTFAVGGLLSCGLVLVLAAATGSAMVSVLLLTLSCFCLGLYTSNVWAITQTLAGPTAAGKWTGIQNAIGNLGGVVSPVVTGWIVERTGSFHLAFVVAAAVVAVGAASYLTLVGKIHTVDWGELPSS
jgi:MFS family permease